MVLRGKWVDGDFVGMEKVGGEISSGIQLFFCLIGNLMENGLARICRKYLGK
jgi:hypothetical protein